jgi:superfamily II DNA/RNA helicase
LQAANKTHLQVITAETQRKEKEDILDDLQKEDGKIRLIIATSTLSMGINIKGLCGIITAINNKS